MIAKLIEKLRSKMIFLIQKRMNFNEIHFIFSGFSSHSSQYNGVVLRKATKIKELDPLNPGEEDILI